MEDDTRKLNKPIQCSQKKWGEEIGPNTLRLDLEEINPLHANYPEDDTNVLNQPLDEWEEFFLGEDADLGYWGKHVCKILSEPNLKTYFRISIALRFWMWAPPLKKEVVLCNRFLSLTEAIFNFVLGRELWEFKADVEGTKRLLRRAVEISNSESIPYPVSADDYDAFERIEEAARFDILDDDLKVRYYAGTPYVKPEEFKAWYENYGSPYFPPKKDRPKWRKYTVSEFKKKWKENYSHLTFDQACEIEEMRKLMCQYQLDPGNREGSIASFRGQVYAFPYPPVQPAEKK